MFICLLYKVGGGWSVIFLFFLMIRRPPRSTLFPTRRSSDLHEWGVLAGENFSSLGSAESKYKNLNNEGYGAMLVYSDNKTMKQDGYNNEVKDLVREIGRAHSELQSHHDLVCRLLLEKKKKTKKVITPYCFRLHEATFHSSRFD